MDKILNFWKRQPVLWYEDKRTRYTCQFNESIIFSVLKAFLIIELLFNIILYL